MDPHDFNQLWDNRIGDNPISINGTFFTKEMAWNAIKCNFLKEKIMEKITIFDYSNKFSDLE